MCFNTIQQIYLSTVAENVIGTSGLGVKAILGTLEVLLYIHDNSVIRCGHGIGREDRADEQRGDSGAMDGEDKEEHQEHHSDSTILCDSVATFQVAFLDW